MSAARAFDAAFRQSLPCRAFLLRGLNFREDSDYFDENNWHEDILPNGKSSRFMGVSWITKLKKFQPKIGIMFLGYFPCEYEAARAFDIASLAEGGPTNFHPSTYPDVARQDTCFSDRSKLSASPGSHESPSLLQQPHCWVAKRRAAQVEQSSEAPAKALAKLAAARVSLPGANLVSQKQLWHDLFEAEGKKLESRPKSASDWNFQSGDLITLRHWPSDGLPFYNVTSKAGKSEAMKATDLVEVVLCNSDCSILARPAVSDKSISQVISQLDALMQVFAAKQASTDYWLMSSFVGNEAQSRMLINLVLFEVCKQNELSLYPEEPLPRSALVPGVADYVLRRGSEVMAVVEAKRCLSSSGHGREQEAWASLLTGAIPQTLSMLAGFQPTDDAEPALSAVQRPWGLITDARHWLLVDLPVQGPPVLQRWPGGAAALTLAGPAELDLLFGCLRQLFLRKAKSAVMC
ncbi:unnamed protein product [Polarella glacialis]|uniref:Uncharacterized protein n=1 Tax=Polarella glacialis TaxID=89957 RepID=A0A813HAU1_POLGL|nr:unnamed protein product [Polarella glacialis]